jgi:hypothetical protein
LEQPFLTPAIDAGGVDRDPQSVQVRAVKLSSAVTLLPCAAVLAAALDALTLMAHHLAQRELWERALQVCLCLAMPCWQVLTLKVAAGLPPCVDSDPQPAQKLLYSCLQVCVPVLKSWVVTLPYSCCRGATCCGK